MPQPSLDTVLQSINLKRAIKSIYKSKFKNFDEVFVQYHCHFALIVSLS